MLLCHAAMQGIDGGKGCQIACVVNGLLSLQANTEISQKNFKDTIDRTNCLEKLSMKLETDC